MTKKNLFARYCGEARWTAVIKMNLHQNRHHTPPPMTLNVTPLRLRGNRSSEFINWCHREEAARRHPLLKVQIRSRFFRTAAQRVLIIKPCVTAKVQSQQKKRQMIVPNAADACVIKNMWAMSRKKSITVTSKKRGGFMDLVTWFLLQWN